MLKSFAVFNVFQVEGIDALQATPEPPPRGVVKAFIEATGVTPDYVARLCRHGRVNARQLGVLWYVDVVSLLEFLSKRAFPTT
jgi:hypothetical protein